MTTTFLIGLGFFTMGLMDPLYDAYVPIFLDDLLERKGMIGLVMTFDNIFALFLIPVFSHLSDQTRTRIGRRMPYIIVTLPLSALFFGLIPFAAGVGLAALIVVLFLLNGVKQAARGPVVALMPDTIPGDFRSEANGVINMMGGIAAIVGTIILSPLMDLDIDLPVIGNTRRKLPFLIAALLVVAATVILFTLVKENARSKSAREAREPIVKSLRILFNTKDRSAFWILVSIFVWFFGYQGLLPFVTLYTRDVVGTSEGIAGLSAGMVAIAYAVFAIPSGYVAHRFGRKRTIRTALIVTSAITALISLHAPVADALALTPALRIGSFWILLFVFGVFWASIITNSFPMLWQMATFANMGVYTGLYYFFSQGAAILAPPVTGTIIDLAGYQSIFLFCAACLLLAFFLMGRVTGGEAEQPAVAP
ncbi:MAG: MFS transporter [Spirochaetaceae bacterium]|nr:MAG: MFS transporter [Spirochaetaceae bacterium]